MKNRIRDAIIKNKLDNQIDLIESAYITTFDSFALSLVKKYHYILNLGGKRWIVLNYIPEDLYTEVSETKGQCAKYDFRVVLWHDSGYLL